MYYYPNSYNEIKSRGGDEVQVKELNLGLWRI